MSKSLFMIMAMCIALYSSLPCRSQNLSIPQKEFYVSADDSVNIEKGSFKKLNIWILRSKSFAKTNVKMSLSSSLPEGVLLNFQPARGHFDFCEATISINPETKPGTYLIVVSGTINYKTKGHIVKLTIPAAPGTQITGGK